ncbi:LamG domain-containing protein [Candidatus Woesearchaeota archaeon]|nr:LamG domain-containing protein [Candidatus Woesearchaeota archaeon]
MANITCKSGDEGELFYDDFEDGSWSRTYWGLYNQTAQDPSWVKETNGYLEIYSSQATINNQHNLVAVWYNKSGFDFKNSEIFISHEYIKSHKIYAGGDGGCTRVLSENNLSDLISTGIYAYGINIFGDCDAGGIGSTTTFDQTNVLYRYNASADEIILSHNGGTSTIDVSSLDKTQNWYLVHMATTRRSGGSAGSDTANHTLYNYEVNLTEDGDILKDSFILNVTSTENYAPEVTSVILNSTYATNLTNENLTAYWTSTDADGDAIVNITDWRLNGTSIALLNLPFEAHENSANNATDYSTHNLNASVAGATFLESSGYDGHGAYLTDGSNDYIHTDTNIKLTDSQSKLSLFFWINLTTTNGGGIAELNDILTGDGEQCIFINDNSGTLQFYVDDGYRDSSASLTAGQWTHIGVTFDGIIWRFYKDGSELSSYTDAEGDKAHWCGDGSGSALNDVYLGVGYNSYHAGIYDNFILLNRTLSDEQILAIYRNETNKVVSQETEVGEAWTACITPNDGTEDGDEICSNQITILEEENELPAVSNILLSSSQGKNTSIENLSISWTSTDADGDSITNITDWRLNDNSFALLNLPFEANRNEENNATDYSTNSNNGTVFGVSFESGGGFNGFGYYSFDGSDDYILVDENYDVSELENISIFAWIKPSSATAERGIIQMASSLTSGSPCFLIQDNSGTLRFYIGGAYREESTSLSQSTWQMVGLTYNGSIWKFYKNGVLLSTYAGGTNNCGVSDDLYIGNGWANYFHGGIDGVLMFNRALSNEQILLLNKSVDYEISSDEINIDENWTACIIPNDKTQDGTMLCSNSLAILESASSSMSISNVILNSTYGTNTTNENLTLYFEQQNAKTNITDWRLGGTSMAVLNMPFETDGKNNITDYSTYNHSGIIQNAKYNVTGDKYGNGAYYFDGNDDSILISHPPEKIYGNYTVMAWVLVKDTGVRNIFSTRYGGPTDPFFDMKLQSGSTIHGDIGDGTNWITVSANAAFTYGVDVWYHVAYAVNTTGYKIYVNGTQKGSGSFNAIPVVMNGSQSVVIGSENGTFEDFYGFIDDVRVYRRALSQKEIQNIYEGKTNEIDAQETITGDVWSVAITPNNGTQDGATVISNNLTIV